MTLALYQTEAIVQRVGELGIATPAQLEQAKQEQAKTREPIGAVLARLGIIRSADIGKRLAPQLGCLAQSVDPSSITPTILRRLSLELCRTHRVVAIQEDPTGRLVVATDDPFTAFALEWLGRQCQATLEMVFVGEQGFAALLVRLSQPDLPATVTHTGQAGPPTSPPPPPPAPSASSLPPAYAPPAGGAGRPAVSPSASPMTAPTTAPPPPPAPPASQPVGLPAPHLSGQAGVSVAKFTLPPSLTVGTLAPQTPPPVAPVAAPVPAAPSGGTDDPTTSRYRDSGSSARKADVAFGEARGGVDDPIIQLVDSILSEAVRLRASDIHIEPLADSLKVRYRIDGVLHEVNTPPRALHGPVTSRLKIMAGLNIAEKRLPQDGRLQLTVESQPLDVRISVLPALHGESIVMRLLARSQSMSTLNELGFSPEDQRCWEQLMARSYGMILVTGPTGSGKTTTLYATLAVLNRPDRKLITVEDPVEYQLPGINQVHVKASVGLTFAAGLRAMLRQAPDVIMIGEIRDQETAQIAIQAALTGHLVFSTLHTNDATSSVTRLTDMGIAPFLVASTIQGVVAQRLVRRVCPSCQVRRPSTPEEQAFLGEPAVREVVEGRGCEECHQSGFRGRVGIYELLVLTDSLRQLIVMKTPAAALKQQAIREGVRTLREDGKLKIRQGSTTMTEILKATPEGE